MSSIINKVKEAVTHDKHDKPSHSTNAGPHDSNVANKVDPRVDSDRDGRAAYGTTATTGTTGTTGTHTGMNTGNTYASNEYGTGSTNAGPHNSNIANKMDPRVDSDLDGRATHHNTAYTQNEYGTGSTNAGPHNSNIANKMDPRVDSDLDGRATHHNTAYNTAGTTTAGTTTAAGGYGTSTTSHANNGPHDSKLMNKLDPRVDSDRDGRNAFGTTDSADTTTKSFEQSQTQSTPTSTTAHGAGSANHGPHNSNLMNKLDPRVDSDRDHRANPTHSTTTGTTMGAGAATMGTSTMGTSTTAHGHHGHHQGHATSTAGPHDSNLANKMDPRVDSDRSTYGTTTGQYGTTTGTGMTGTGLTDTSTTGTGMAGTGMTGHQYNTRSTNAGPHDSNLANKVDPRVDSDMDNRARHQHMGTTTNVPAGSSYASTGTAEQHGTAGPHKSDLMNKLDPRVDSDLDGSRTVGNTQRQY